MVRYKEASPRYETLNTYNEKSWNPLGKSFHFYIPHQGYRRVQNEYQWLLVEVKGRNRIQMQGNLKTKISTVD